MKSVTVDMLRAHLMAASLMAMAIEAVALPTLLLFPVERAVFDSALFRLCAALAIAAGVALLRYFAHCAFELALRERHANYRSPACGTVSIGAGCPRRPLVLLHLRLTGKPFELAED
jgi:hypothetical protein